MHVVRKTLRFKLYKRYAFRKALIDIEFCGSGEMFATKQLIVAYS